MARVQEREGGGEGWRGGGLVGGAGRAMEAEGPRFTAVSPDFCTTHPNSAACRLGLGGRALMRCEGPTPTLQPLGQAPPELQLQLL